MLNKKAAAANLLMILAILACQNTLIPADNPTPAPPADIYLELRSGWLTVKAEDLAIEFEPGSKVPYAVLMDMGIDADVVTIGSSIVGDGSLLTSTGGGVVGGIGHENVRNASIHFVQLAGEFVEGMTLTTEYPLPQSGYVRFYLITPSGIYMTDEIKKNDLAFGIHELSALYSAGDDVIAELRLVTGQ